MPAPASRQALAGRTTGTDKCCADDRGQLRAAHHILRDAVQRSCLSVHSRAERTVLEFERRPILAGLWLCCRWLLTLCSVVSAACLRATLSAGPYIRTGAGLGLKEDAAECCTGSIARKVLFHGKILTLIAFDEFCWSDRASADVFSWALGSSTPVSVVSTQGMQVQGMQSVHLHASLPLNNATHQLGANFTAPTEIWEA